MFHNKGLSLEQAPPISVVFRFFLVGAIFGVIEGIWILFQGKDAMDAYSNTGLVTTHLFTLGIMLSFMLGALFQMLPVLAGVSFKEPVKRAIQTQYPTLFGTVTLLFGLYYDSALAYSIAGILLLIGIMPVAFEMLNRLIALPNHSASSRGMGFAIYGLIFTISLGLVLIAIRSGWSADYYPAIRDSHIAFGTIGWIALLIISVSFQVVEMFYVTTPFPKLLAKYLPAFIAFVATLMFTLTINSNIASNIFYAILYLSTGIYSLTALNRLRDRKRLVNDATVELWSIGLFSLAIFSALGVIYSIINIGNLYILMAMKIVFPVFATSIIFAMSYKIVPFLTWFHLNAQGYFKAPMMHEVINPKYAKFHLYIHLLSIFLAVISVSIPYFWHLTGAVIVISFGLLLVAIYRAWHIYIATEQSGEKFEF